MEGKERQKGEKARLILLSPKGVLLVLFFHTFLSLGTPVSLPKTALESGLAFPWSMLRKPLA
jgi:hypothetical protein